MMDSIQNLVKALNPDNVEQLSKMTGLDKEKTQSAVNQILPALLKGLSDNTDKPEGAESLANALERDHNGSILNNVSAAFQNGDKAEDTGQETNGLGILQHIFGGKQTEVAQQIGSKLNIDQDQIMSIMGKIAPIVMGFLGKAKKEGNMGSSDLSSMLTMASSMLGGGKGNDDTMGSLIKMGSQLFGNKGEGKSSGGGLMDTGSSLLKGFLKKK